MTYEVSSFILYYDWPEPNSAPRVQEPTKYKLGNSALHRGESNSLGF